MPDFTIPSVIAGGGGGGGKGIGDRFVAFGGYYFATCAAAHITRVTYNACRRRWDHVRSELRAVEAEYQLRRSDEEKDAIGR